MPDECKPAIRPRPRLEKRPGDDWIVEILIASEGEAYPVTVFGAADRQAAIADALSGFTFNHAEDLKVLRVERLA